MRIGFRKILRDLWRSKGRTLLAVLEHRRRRVCGRHGQRHA